MINRYIKSRPLLNAIKSGTHSIDNNIYCIRRSSARFEIWQKTDRGNWTVWEIWRHVQSSQNGDSWRVYKIRLTAIKEETPLIGTTEINPIELMYDGSQLEFAFRPIDAPDFFGGFHGDELVQDVIFLVDGTEKTLDSPSSFNSELKRFEMVQHTECFDPRDSIVKMGDMYIRHIWTKDGLRLKFRFVWDADVTITNAYAGMFPARRSEDTSTKAKVIDEPTVYDVSTDEHDRPGGNSYGFELWNDINNVFMSVEFEDLTWFNNYENSSGRGIWVTNNSNYNKVYPTRVFSSSGVTENVESGDRWTCDVTYRIFNKRN